MSKLLITSVSAIVLAVGITAALGPPGRSRSARGGVLGPHGARLDGPSGLGPNMKGFGMMGAGMMDPDMMLVMMDTNGDGALSLDEFQAMPTRMFKYLDANHDGKVTKDELDAFHADGDDNSGQ